MNTTLLRLAVLGMLLFGSACSTLRVTIDYDPAANFTRYRTFTLKHGAASNDPIAVDRLDIALEAALVARGLTRVQEAGDLSIVSHFKIGKETQLRTTNYGYDGWPGWRFGRLGMQTQTTVVDEIPIGTVVVDAVDNKTGKAVWRGIAKDRISASGSPGEHLKQAQEAAQELFSGFPPAIKK